MPGESTSTVLVVGRLDGLLDALAARSVSFEHVPDTDAALEALEDGRFDCLLSAACVAPLSGIELAAVAHERAGVPSVVVSDDVPAAATDVPGVTDIVEYGDHEGAVECLRGASKHAEAEGTSTATMATLEELSGKERELEAYETAVNTAADGICRLDGDGRVVMVNDALCELTGYDREALLGRSGETVLTGGEDGGNGGRGPLETALDSDRPSDVTVETTIERADGETVPVACRTSVLLDEGTDDGTVLVVSDVGGRVAHERTLTELHDVSRTLLAAERSQAISDTVAAAASEILDIEVVGVYRFDRQANLLRPECVTEHARELLGEPPTFGPGDGIAWEVFVRGESRIYDDVSRAEGVHNPATPIRSELLIPVGNHGVLLCGSTVPGAYDERTAELAGILAANAEAAYERMERTRRLRDREAELRAQNRRLEQLDDVNERVRQVTHDLVDATTREEIERVVCDGLAAVDDYELVWVGERDPIDADLTVRRVAGLRRGYLDAVTFTDGDGTPIEPTAQAAHRREAVVVDRVADELRDGSWQGEALSRDYLSVASVPLLHGGIPYGTLSVYANRTDAFDTETRSVLADLGETVAHAMATVEQRRALLSDEQVELVFGLDDLPTVLFELAGSLQGAVEVERVLPDSESGSLVYGRATGTTEQDFRTACAATGGISDAQVITDDGEGLQFEVRIEGPCVIEPVADHGGTFSRLRLADGRGQLAATFPQSAAVTEFIRAYIDRYPGTELLARREVGAPEASQRIDAALSDLTERQREALEVAYEHGFFAWPRETSSEEIAASMNIAGPTFLEHLRRAEGKVVRHVLEGWRRSDAPD